MKMIDKFTVDLSRFGLGSNIIMYAYAFSKDVNYVDLTGSKSLSFKISLFGVFNEDGFGFKFDNDKTKEVNEILEKQCENTIPYRSQFNNNDERDTWMKAFDKEEQRCRYELFKLKKEIGEVLINSVIALYTNKEVPTISGVMDDWINKIDINQTKGKIA